MNSILNNKVFISGEIVTDNKFSHEIFGEKFFEFYLKTQRLSDITDLIPITISERLIDNEKLKVGNVISLYGQFRSYNKLIDDKSKLMLTVFVREIIENNASDENKIELSGFLCKEPVYRMTPFNREICDILVAVNRSYNKSDYIPCIAWGRNARFVKNLKVGEKIKIHGRIQSRNYQKKTDNGEILEKTAYEVSVNKIFVEKELCEKENNNSLDFEYTNNYA